ncbi:MULTISPECIES: hypothetical protein [unclassified Providencia]|uniref:hypothetical protein n=1 Tax=unclassified Providencia TaxID=2633465 RepID=UPI00234B203F|nr:MULTISPECIES: hypothetical protein [unclassified Providencia]
MSDFLIVVKDNAPAITTLVGVFTIIGGFIGAWIKNKREKEKYKLEKQKIEADKKSTYQQMITNNIAPMRQEWINDIRNKASNFLSNCDFIAAYKLAESRDSKQFIQDFESKFRQISLTHSELYFYLQMALPFSREVNGEEVSEKIRLHIKYIDDRFIDGGSIDKEKYEDINQVINCCSNNFKVLFKNEWNETKSLKEIDDEKYKVEKLPPPECTCSVKNTTLH